MPKLPRFSFIACLAFLLCAVPAAQAASPVLTRILPRGAQRGTEVELTFTGDRLADAQEVLLYQPGITITKVEPSTEKDKVGKQVKVTAKIAPDARTGEYGLRLRTASGLTEFRTFWVGLYPVSAEKEPNSDFKSPQPITFNQTITGVIESEDQDFFLIDLKKGQRFTAEVEGMRLGETIFDPYLAILDENRFELKASDDTALLKQDSVISMIAPRDGKFVLQLRDSAFGGSGAAHYRLHVGNFPRPRIVSPMGGQAGKSIPLSFLGDPSGTIKQTIALPDKPNTPFELFCIQDNLSAPSPNAFRVVEFPGVAEVEPNDTPKTATAHAGAIPVAFDGILSARAEASSQSPETAAAAQDADYFKFTAKKGQVLDINVFARRLRSPLDPVLSVYNAAGNQIATNDDSGGPDSYLKFAVPADGDYLVRVRDHLKAAGDLYAYRIEITPAKGSVAISIPQYTQQYTQERQAVTVPKGNRYATLMRVQRQDVTGALTVECPELPPGVKMTVENLEGGVDTVPVLFEADASAKVGGKLVDVIARIKDAPAGAPESTPGHFKQTIELVTNGNQAPLYTTTVDKMGFAVADEVPFTLRLEEPKAPLVQGGEMKLKVIAERKGDFKGPIIARLLFKPPGVDGLPQVEIPADQTTVEYPINATDGAPAKKWKLVMTGSADIGGTAWVSSPYAVLEVAPPFVTAKIAKANIEQGKPVKMTADLEVKTKWQGKAKAELIGLPGGAVAEPKEITADDAKVEFDVTTQKTTPAANHNGLFVKITLAHNGEPVIHNVGRGGLLRIDAPLVAKTAKPETKSPEKATAKTPEKTPAKTEKTPEKK